MKIDHAGNCSPQVYAPSNYGEAQLTDDEFIASEGKKIKVNCRETVQC